MSRHKRGSGPISSQHVEMHRLSLSAVYPRTADRNRRYPAPFLWQPTDNLESFVNAAPMRAADRPRIAIPREAQPRSATEVCLASAPTPLCFCSAPCLRVPVVNLFLAAPCRLHRRGLARLASRPPSTSNRAAGRSQIEKRQCRTSPPKPPRGNLARWREAVNTRCIVFRATDSSEAKA
jgi:hypothetical protein